MISRRGFVGTLSAAPFVGLAARASTREFLAPVQQDPRPAREIARDESFWQRVQQAFDVDRSLINLNNGGVSPAPLAVHGKFKERLDYSNNAPPYNIWQVLDPGRENVRRHLARTFGAQPEEVAITRNASESLMICQHGLPLERGDQVLTTDQDYPRMLQAFAQRERRHGIEVVKIELPVPCSDDREVVRRFRGAITDRTRMILVSHMINLTGQVLPVKDVCRLGRERGIPVVVDGAHAIAHFPFLLRDLECDYYGTSLHKWLFASIGTGMLYVRRERIKDLWPLFAAPESRQDDIRKFEEIGTNPAANPLSIAEALTFHEGIGAERKAERLVHLRNRWVEALRPHDNVELLTDLAPGRAFAIATVRLRNVETQALGEHLWDQHRILTAPIVHRRFSGIRVSPSVYTTLGEIDRFVEVMGKAADRGV